MAIARAHTRAQGFPTRRSTERLRRRSHRSFRHVSRGHVADRRASTAYHRRLELVAQVGEQRAYADLAARCQRPEYGTTDENEPRPERERLEHVPAPPHPTIHPHFQATCGRLYDGGQSIERRDGTVEHPAAVVRDNDRVDAVLGREPSVLRCENPLQDER